MIVDSKYKAAFAAFLIKQPLPFEAALMVFPNDTPSALWIAQNWQFDEEVIAMMQELIDSGEADKDLPTKGDLARLAWDLARNDRVRTIDRLAAARLFAEVRGFIEKPGTNVNVPVTVVPSVMVVENHGTNENWEKQLEEQQRRLVSENNAPTKH